MWKQEVRRACIAVGKFGRHLWREAVDTDDPHWPPPWLYISGALVVVIVLVQVGSVALAGLLSHAGASARSSAWGQLIAAPLRAYFEHHSAGLPVSPVDLMKMWGFAGLVLFVGSLTGSLGARVGWTVFGASTCAAIYAGTPPPAQWTASGIAAFAWSGASIFAFCHIDRQRSRRRTKQRIRAESESDRLEDVRKRAHRFAKRQGYRDLEEYFAERGNQNLDTITNELKIPKPKVSPLREEYLESGISVRSRLKPRVQREIKADIRSGQCSDSEIRERHRCTQTDIRRIRSSVEASSAEEATADGDSSFSPHSSELPDPELVGVGPADRVAMPGGAPS
jgi:hypothetical protein